MIQNVTRNGANMTLQSLIINEILRHHFHVKLRISLVWSQINENENLLTISRSKYQKEKEIG